MYTAFLRSEVLVHQSKEILLCELDIFCEAVSSGEDGKMQDAPVIFILTAFQKTLPDKGVYSP